MKTSASRSAMLTSPAPGTLQCTFSNVQQKSVARKKKLATRRIASVELAARAAGRGSATEVTGGPRCQTPVTTLQRRSPETRETERPSQARTVRFGHVPVSDTSNGSATNDPQ